MYLKKDSATPHPGACKHKMQYDGRPDWRFWVWIEMWSIGSLSGKFVKNGKRGLLMRICRIGFYDTSDVGKEI